MAPRYFEKMRTPLLLGREFTSRDDAGALGVAMVNETFVRLVRAERQFPWPARLLSRSVEDAQVIGVVSDAVYETLRQAPPPTVYVPYLHGGSTPSFEIYAGRSLAQVAITNCFVLTSTKVIVQNRAPMKDPRKPTAAELRILQVLWSRGPSTGSRRGRDDGP